MQERIRYSGHSLIEKELEFEDGLKGFKRILADLERRKERTLKIQVPSDLLTDCKSHIRMASNLGNYEYEISDVFEILIEGWQKQYIEAVEPARMARSLRALQEKTINHYNGEKDLFRRNSEGKMATIRVSVGYDDLLDLEVICRRLTHAYNEEEVIFIVESVLAALFCDFMNRMHRGGLKNLARMLAAHVHEREGGETA